MPEIVEENVTVHNILQEYLGKWLFYVLLAYIRGYSLGGVAAGV